MNELMNWLVTTGLLDWCKAMCVRAFKTAAQAALGFIGASATIGEVNWSYVLSGALMAAFVSILTSFAGLPEVADGASVAKLAKHKAE